MICEAFVLLSPLMPTLSYLTTLPGAWSKRWLTRSTATPEADGYVVGGYTIIQPRVSTTLPGAMATYFTSLFTDAKGTDFYTKAVSDVYQDLFNESIFHGKAIYDLQAFHRRSVQTFP